MTTPDNRLIADATDFVLDRLEASRNRNQRRVAEIDAGAPRDARALAAMWSAAFGIAEHTLNVLASLDPDEAEQVMDSYRRQVDEYRRQ